jgi:hypothetical protein
VEWERADREEEATAAIEPEPAPLVAVRLAATLPRDLPATQPEAGESPAPAAERPRPRSLADDPVGRLFPDAQWMG